MQLTIRTTMRLIYTYLLGVALLGSIQTWPTTTGPWTTGFSTKQDSDATASTFPTSTTTGKSSLLEDTMTPSTGTASITGTVRQSTDSTSTPPSVSESGKSNLLHQKFQSAQRLHRFSGRVVLANTRVEDSEEWGVGAEQAEMACDRIARYQPQGPQGLLRAFVDRFWFPKSQTTSVPMQGHLLSIRSEYEVIALSRLLKPLPRGAYWTGGRLVRYRVNNMHVNEQKNHVILTWTDGRVGNPKVLGMTALDEDQLREGYTYCLAINLHDASWQARDCNDRLPYACLITPRQVGFSNQVNHHPVPSMAVTETTATINTGTPIPTDQMWTSFTNEGSQATMENSDITTPRSIVLSETVIPTGLFNKETTGTSNKLLSRTTQQLLNADMTTPHTASTWEAGRTGTAEMTTHQLLNEDMTTESTSTSWETGRTGTAGMTTHRLLNEDMTTPHTASTWESGWTGTAGMTTHKLLNEDMTTESTSTSWETGRTGTAGMTTPQLLGEGITTPSTATILESELTGTPGISTEKLLDEEMVTATAVNEENADEEEEEEFDEKVSTTATPMTSIPAQVLGEEMTSMGTTRLREFMTTMPTILNAEEVTENPIADINAAADIDDDDIDVHDDDNEDFGVLAETATIREGIIDFGSTPSTTVSSSTIASLLQGTASDETAVSSVTHGIPTTPMFPRTTVNGIRTPSTRGLEATTSPLRKIVQDRTLEHSVTSGTSTTARSP